MGAVPRCLARSEASSGEVGSHCLGGLPWSRHNRGGGDPDVGPQAGMKLHTGDYSKMGAELKSLGLPTVIVQEGGYKMELIPELVSCFIGG